MSDDGFPSTLLDAIQYFSDGNNAFNFMVRLRWPDGVRCPRCGTDAVRPVANRQTWECKHCKVKKQFSVRVGTIFEDSPLPLSKWLAVIWLIANAKNGVSSYEVHRSIGVTQKTAWFMLQRIRLAMKTGTFEKLSGEVEVDETFVGGRVHNMKGDRRERAYKYGRPCGVSGKSIVMGLMERGGTAMAIHVPHRRKTQLEVKVREHVEEGATIYSDSLNSYNRLSKGYTHLSVDHAIEYVNGQVHTNGLENFWSLLKRTLRGTYVSVDPEHLFRYLDEQVFRFNTRRLDDGGRFLKAAAAVIGKRITYQELIAKQEPC